MPDEKIPRRDFLHELSRSLMALGLCEWLVGGRLLASPARSEAQRWLRRVYELSREVKSGQLSAVTWQDAMASQLAAVDLPDWLTYLDFDALSAQAKLPARGELFQDLTPPAIAGAVPAAVFYLSLVGFHQGRSIPPHGHRDLVSSFLVLRGELLGRHYDRAPGEGKTYRIRPTLDRVFRPAEFSSVSDEKDNVHWFTAQTEAAFLVDFGVRPLTPGQHPSGRFFLDVANAEPDTGDWMRVKPLLPADAYAIYG